MLRKVGLALLALFVLSACQAELKDDPLVIRDEDPLKAFMLPKSRDTVWTYRRETIGLIEDAATVSIAVENLSKESAGLTYTLDGLASGDLVQGIGFRADTEIAVRPDGAVQVTDPHDQLTFHPDGRVESQEGLEFELLGTETLTTPAGTFACVKYRVRRTPSVDFPMTLDGTQWWGKGAGLVKAVSTVEGFNAGTRTTLELVSLER